MPIAAKAIQVLGGWNDAYTARDPVGTIREAGLRVLELDEFDGRWLPVVRPHVMGVAAR